MIHFTIKVKDRQTKTDLDIEKASLQEMLLLYIELVNRSEEIRSFINKKKDNIMQAEGVLKDFGGENA